MDVSTPEWSSTNNNNVTKATKAADEVTFTPSMSAAAGMEISDATSSQSSPSSQRTLIYRAYRFFKFITIAWSLLLFIAQVVSVIYLPFDGVELVLKIFLSSFSALVILNELEWWGALRNSPLFWNFIPRGYFYAFIGLVSTEENNLKPKPSSPLTDMPVDYTAALFIETSSWAMVAVGILYLLFGLCCGQHYLGRVKDDHSNRVAERERTFEEGVQSDTALSRQMIT
eukprot:CAMPEP_0172579342 /NCGR_PEP_ID=MMETSP1067-20121228/139198_1 /TAXON_ID=265564 ORGANISM="Thalassiosira punctigera, Strain Tpunct2005C2" /NCGR_SAMPLE_ID=MMETSP1067 /ASSEMBLY_ACC=CAM_ASM_000444 /LENGTH=227 /DNA_ID=CAMNT_0013372059 /DNA_START=32 /DNA_END=715 /DNA_ORIENTATION=-